MTQAEDKEDDLLWQAEVLLEHRRQRKIHWIITVALVFVLLAMGLTPPLLLVLAEIDLFGEIGRSGVIFCFLPLLIPLLLANYAVWRCPACDRFLGRGDPQFCPHCGVQLQFLDK